MKGLTFGSALLATALMSGCAMAQMGGRFNSMDGNGDGYIDASELTAMRLAAFDRADTNGDGALTREEAAAVREAMKGRAFGEGRDGFGLADRDGDGRILRSDIETARPLLIDAADSNGDERLSRKELRRYVMSLRNGR